MIQLILMLLGFTFPNNNVYNTNQTSITVQSNTDFSEDMDTSGETTQLPPRK